MGELVWQYSVPYDEQPFLGVSRVHPPVLAGGTLFLPATDGAVYALNASDGALLWAYRTHPVGTPQVPTALRAARCDKWNRVRCDTRVDAWNRCRYRRDSVVAPG